MHACLAFIIFASVFDPSIVDD